MRWPWQRQTERRESQPFTDAVVAALIAGAGSDTATAAATAALEACAAIYAMAFAMARVEDAGPAAMALKPRTLALIARNLIRRGEDIHVIDVSDDGLTLTPAGSWDLRGGPDPGSWMVRADLFGPSGNLTRFLPHDAVTHCRYAVDSARPWQGLGPLQWANATGALAGRLEAGMSAEAGAPVAQLLPVPIDGGDGDSETDPLAKLKADIANAKGRAALVETTAAGWGQGPAGAPRADWKQSRVGPEWPAVLNESRQNVAEDVACACGVPFVLLAGRAEGTAQREGLRRLLHLALEPLGSIVAAELADKLGAPSLRLSFEPLMASDLAGKARAFKGFVEAGLSVDQAAAIVAIGEG